MADKNITKGMRGGGKYAEPKWDGVKRPAEGDLGYSEYPVGQQDNAEAGAAHEGQHAVDEQVANGTVTKTATGPTGYER